MITTIQALEEPMRTIHTLKYLLFVALMICTSGIEVKAATIVRGNTGRDIQQAINGLHRIAVRVVLERERPARN